ncbi:hypothetical protein APR41_06195 [Salegentibacter salinarum]|uniref:Uncharacterized protein n=1 Tax=Salegentibacter salinarum TaxID=447422 RepID=A0A2N0TQK7_9FLAO|nr:hypothetical protein [Salegentibacter salinarum]PKD17023.1 hypothetical protein APR41_06195 [Salegentibacter salinarum]SKB53952.1 hypothetical protein SAMN05660903_01262 [Salegentibacter salinarum]
METIFRTSIRYELIECIKKVNKNDKAKWGQMNVYQMLKHTTYWNGWILGKEDHTYKQILKEYLAK